MPDLRERLRAGAPLVGTFLTSGDPALAEATAGAWDLVVVDLEHSALDRTATQGLLVAARAARVPALVRVPGIEPGWLNWVLDGGAAGIVVPLVDDPDRATLAIRALRYPPLGDRSMGPRRLLTLARQGDSPPEPPMCLVQIETASGVERANEIAAVAGVDAVVLGCSDYLNSIGSPASPDSGPLRLAARQVAEAARKSGVAFGVAGAFAPAKLATAAPEATLLLYATDQRIVLDAMADASGACRSALGARFPSEIET